jgi:hypothetical protein
MAPATSSKTEDVTTDLVADMSRPPQRVPCRRARLISSTVWSISSPKLASNHGPSTSVSSTCWSGLGVPKVRTTGFLGCGCMTVRVGSGPNCANHSPIATRAPTRNIPVATSFNLRHRRRQIQARTGSPLSECTVNSGYPRLRCSSIIISSPSTMRVSSVCSRSECLTSSYLPSNKAAFLHNWATRVPLARVTLYLGWNT